MSGIVIGVGEGVENFQVGDRVTIAGATIANHAEYVDVPKNLVCKMPKELSFEDASTVTLGSISLQEVKSRSKNGRILRSNWCWNFRVVMYSNVEGKRG